MSDHLFADEDLTEYREHIARLEKERVWFPIVIGAVVSLSYYFAGHEFSYAEQALLTAVFLGVWVIFNEVRTARIERLRLHAWRVAAKARKLRNLHIE